MKKLLLFTLLFPLYTLFAQNGKFEKNNEVFQTYSYKECINKYEPILFKTYEINRILADSYLKERSYYKAEEYFKEVVNSKKATSEDIYKYASVLYINQKYREATVWMEKFSNMEKCDSRAARFLADKNYYITILNDDPKFKIRNLDMNTENQEFGATYYNKKIIFASTRQNSKLLKRIFSKNKLPFLDLYSAEIKNRNFINLKQFNKKFNKEYCNGPASLSNKGTFMALTQNKNFAKNKNETIKLEIFTSQKNGETWDEPKPVSFNKEHFSVGHPSLTSDGTKMYFASDMPGGYGGVDIYIVKKEVDGSWGTPQNLGNVINTEGDEDFPFIHENGMLFFSSNGLLGLGGLDIFYTKLSNGKYLKPKNIGTPINSSYDDFSFIIDKNMRKGYFSSNCEGGRGGDDIYSLRLLKELTFDVILKGKTIDKNSNPLANVNVSLFDKDGNIVKTTNSDKEGNYIFEVNPKFINKLMASKPKFITDIKTVKVSKSNHVIVQDFQLEQLSDFSILCTVNDKNNKMPIANAKVTYIDNKTGQKHTTNTFDNGEFLVQLNNYKLNDSINFLFIIEKDGYASKTIPYNNILRWIGEYKFNVKIQKIEVGKDLGKILDIKPIYFDFDKSAIRPDAAIELDKIVSIMNKYPNMIIELSSHTDCRGSGIYNLKLSDRRAKASAYYIKTKISNPTRIYGEGFGEKKPIVKCPCSGTNNIHKCSETDHQKNRRTEFKIIRK